MVTKLATESSLQAPTLDAIKSMHTRLKQWIVQTPVCQSHSLKLQQHAGANTQLFFKLELLQHTGTFKPRGALASLLQLTPEALQRGVVAFSGGNHAIGVSYAARALKTSAKVVMPRTASPLRIQRCQAYGAEVIFAETIKEASERMQEIAQSEQRTVIHPYEGYAVALGTATLGLELLEQVPDLEAVVVPIGGGGLIAGMGAAIKQLSPKCEVYGVEPEGAPTMYRSLQTDVLQKLDKVNTIADSLAPPLTLPYSYHLCKTYVDEVVLVDDPALRAAMRLLQEEMKLAVEPASAAATAGWHGPLRERLQGKRVGLIVCGANIDTQGYCNLLQQN